MIRAAFNIAAGLSLFFLLCVIALWLRAQWVADTLDHTNALRDVSVMISPNTLMFIHISPPQFPDNDGLSGLTWSSDHDVGNAEAVVAIFAQTSKMEPHFKAAGFLVSSGVSFWNSSGTPAQCVAVFLPHWMLACLFSVLPLLCGWTHWRRWRLIRRRRLQNACLQCGYDLRGSEGKCPECGAARAA